MNESKRKLPEGQIREFDTFFGEKIPTQEELLQLRELKPNVWLNCVWMIGPVFLTVTSTLLTGLPLAMFIVVPGTIAGLIGWISDSFPPIKQIWRSVFIGCFASWFFLGVLASQW